MKPISIRYLSSHDVAALVFKDHGILAATETNLRGQDLGNIIIEPRVHRVADKTCGGHFNVLRG